MFDRTSPTGSPLSPAQFPDMDIVRGVPIQPKASPFADVRPDYMDLAATAARSLPKPPPTKKATIWDKEHISETLAGVGAGFFAGQNFGDGLGAAAQTIAGRTRQLREEERPDITYGGPGDQFEITTDRRTGAKTVRQVPEFAAAVERERAAKNRPDFKTQTDMRSRALFAIATQVPPEQRAEAYRDLINNPGFYGVDPSGMPREWDDRYGTVAGTMGLSVNEGLSQKRDDAKLEDDIRHRRVVEAQGNQRVQQGNAKVLQGAARVAQSAAKLRAAPPSTRKPRSGTLSIGTAMSGYVYQGGDPANRNNWKKQ
ncbi:hypothetical protein [Sphingomonas mucosissima]|uniref:Uncharacterized protein n=1 Tax=Sphingomonas mucosissima TaxID=370959 RepID=A0A245ZPX0_9SPHN|nr:hypothetical protein [Sphingomonas mucosissima]OWK31786.1 hypothetical protein SPMU_01040 [Sphingomonas mucosissima]